MVSLSQKQIILGGLLGDSSMCKNSITFSQCEKQYEYVRWKNKILCNDENKIKKTYNTWGNKKYPRYYFYYSIHNETDLLCFIKKNLYSREGRKKISLKYLNELTPLGLAVWWMDDGNISLSKRDRYGKWSTHCFNYEEHILLKKYFKEKWDINVNIKQEKGKYYFLRLNVAELKKLIKIIYPYVLDVPNMSYKVDLNYKYDKRIGEDFQDIYYQIKSA